jgi:hypothetical protein
MKYESPVLAVVGAAQVMILGGEGPLADSCLGHPPNDTSCSMGIVGLDD